MASQNFRVRKGLTIDDSAAADSSSTANNVGATLFATGGTVTIQSGSTTFKGIQFLNSNSTTGLNLGTVDTTWDAFFGDGSNLSCRTNGLTYFQNRAGSSTYATMGATFTINVDTTSTSATDVGGTVGAYTGSITTDGGLGVSKAVKIGTHLDMTDAKTMSASESYDITLGRTITVPASHTNSYYSASIRPTFTGSTSTGSYFASIVIPVMGSTVNFASMYNYFSRLDVSSGQTSATIPSFYHYMAGGVSVAASTTLNLTTYHAFYASTPSSTGTVTIANVYGATLGISSSAGTTQSWNVYANGSAHNYFAGNVLIGTTTDNGADKLQVSGDALVTGTYYVNSTKTDLAEAVRSRFNLTGGGTISVNTSAGIAWSTRFILMNNGRGTTYGTNGYFDISMPADGTVITGLGGASNYTVAGGVIVLGSWSALYYILPIGASNTSVAANFRLVGYTTDVDIPPEWVLICQRNGDNGQFYFPGGISLNLGYSYNTTYGILAYIESKATKDSCIIATTNNIPYGTIGTNTITISHAALTFTTVASNNITLTGHSFNTGDPIRLVPSVQNVSNYLTVNGAQQTTSNTTTWYVNRVDANTIKIATSLGNAVTSVTVAITITGAVTVTASVPLVIDGTTLVSGDRVLVKNQTSSQYNGIYYVSGTTHDAWVLSRSTDFDTWTDIPGASCIVEGGSTNADTNWICTSNSGGTLNTTAITWANSRSNAISVVPYYSSSPLMTLSPIWYSSGTTFTALKVNVTDTASATSSMLLDLQIGGWIGNSMGDVPIEVENDG